MHFFYRKNLSFRYKTYIVYFKHFTVLIEIKRRYGNINKLTEQFRKSNTFYYFLTTFDFLGILGSSLRPFFFLFFFFFFSILFDNKLSVHQDSRSFRRWNPNPPRLAITQCPPNNRDRSNANKDIISLPLRADGWMVIAGVRGVSSWEYGGWHRYGSLGLRWGKG